MKIFYRKLAGKMSQCCESSVPGMMRLHLEGTFDADIYREASTYMLIPSDFPDSAIEILSDFWLNAKEQEYGMPVGLSCSSNAWTAGFADSQWDALITHQYDDLIQSAMQFYKSSEAENAADRKDISTSEELAKILTLLQSLEAQAGDAVGYTMANGKYHLFIYVDADIFKDKLAYTIEPNRVEPDGSHTPLGETYAVPFGDFALFLCECLAVIERHFVEAPDDSATSGEHVTLSTFPDHDHFFSKDFTVRAQWLTSEIQKLGYYELDDFLDNYTWDTSNIIFETAYAECEISLISQSV